MILFRSAPLLDKSIFAAKRRVILPIHPSPGYPSHMIRASFTTDPLKQTRTIRFASGGEAQREVLNVPKNLEGVKSRQQLEQLGDADFKALVDFIQTAEPDTLISGRKFQRVYDALTAHDNVFIWLCHVAMAVLNPGDMRSRLVYRHLEGLIKAVASEEMTQRTAFRFYESAVRTPAFRAMAERQLEKGASTRLVGLCAAAEAMRKLGIGRRPMSAYFELFQRISERSEALTPWGFPPLLQFEERLQLEPRLRFFSRENEKILSQRRRRTLLSNLLKLRGSRIFWVPPTWRQTKRFINPSFTPYPGLIPD